MLKKLYTQVDFLNLTADDIKKIKNILNIEVPVEQDQYQYLFDNINIIEDNQEANKIVANKLLAGQVAVKWYRYTYNEENTKQMLKERLESAELGFDAEAKERVNLDIKDDIVSVAFDGNIYTIKIFMVDGYKRISNGVESKREMIMKSVIVNMNIDERWVEIRASGERCNKIVKILESKLGVHNLQSIRILNRYNNDVNSFKNSLIDGFYLNYKAAPSQVIELTEDDGITIATMINIIDEYFENKDGEVLLRRLEELNYDNEGLSLSSILLAGVESLGMKIRNDSERDMSTQSLYTILKDHFIEDSGYIRFAIVPNGSSYTMQIGLNSNSIVFRSSVTEDVIRYIREKVL